MNDQVEQILLLIMCSRNWRTRTVALCFVYGLADKEGWTQTEWARLLGISKQALNQEIQKLRRLLLTP